MKSITMPNETYTKICKRKDFWKLDTGDIIMLLTIKNTHRMKNRIYKELFLSKKK